MQFIFFFLFFFSWAEALEIQVNFGKENNENFSVLNLKHTKAFRCIEDRDVYNIVTSITCTIPQTPVNNSVPTNTAFFNLSTSIVDTQLVIKIVPKHKAKLFATFLDLKQENRIPKERPEKSKQWQIIGYISKIPFLSDQKTNGLNFPIKITNPQDLYIGQLDVNLRPLKYQKEIDFKNLQEIKTLFEQKKYADVIRDADLAMKTFPLSVFYKDFLFYKIRSLAQSPSKEDIDMIINSSLEWIKQSSSDQKAPEVLYILANAYSQNQLDNEAYYYYKHLISEYPQSDWSALSKMQIAKKFSNHPSFKADLNLFSEAYTEAKTQKVKDTVLMEWGISLIHHNHQESRSLIENVVKNNPNFFSDDLNYTFSIIQTLANNSAFDLASEIGEILLQKLPKHDERSEKLIFNLGEWFAQAGNIQKAHLYNKRFLTLYPKSDLAAKVELRDNQLLFKSGEQLGEKEQFDLLDKIIQNYPNTEESKKAYLKKAQLLFDLKRYQEILDIQAFIPQSPLIGKSKTQLILQALKDKKCKKIPALFPNSDLSEITEKERFDLFDCLYSLSYYSDAKTLIQNPKNAQEKLPWLYRLSKVLNKMGDFIQSRLSGEDALNLARTLNKPEYYDIGFTLFSDFTQLKLNKHIQEISLFLQKHFSEDKRMLEVWYLLLQNAQKDNDQNAIQIYAKDILSLQQKLKLSDYTPNIDFVLVYSFIQNKQYAEAKNHLEKLLQIKLEPQDKQKALYMQGIVLKALSEEYTNSFKKCLEIKDETNWRNLCSKSL